MKCTYCNLLKCHSGSLWSRVAVRRRRRTQNYNFFLNVISRDSSLRVSRKVPGLDNKPGRAFCLEKEVVCLFSYLRSIWWMKIHFSIFWFEHLVNLLPCSSRVSWFAVSHVSFLTSQCCCQIVYIWRQGGKMLGLLCAHPLLYLRLWCLHLLFFCLGFMWFGYMLQISKIKIGQCRRGESARL